MEKSNTIYRPLVVAAVAAALIVGVLPRPANAFVFGGRSLISCVWGGGLSVQRDGIPSDSVTDVRLERRQIDPPAVLETRGPIRRTGSNVEVEFLGEVPVAVANQQWVVDFDVTNHPEHDTTMTLLSYEGQDCDDIPQPTDVNRENPFAGEIAFVLQWGYLNGYPDSTFRPSNPITRQAFAAVLYRMKFGPDAPPACTEAPFVDVPADHPFCPHITWMADTGISTGYPGGYFKPANTITRQSAGAFLYRMREDGYGIGCPAGPIPAHPNPGFTDVPPGHPFEQPIWWMAANSITNGYPDGSFKPGATITRQAGAAYLARAIYLCSAG